VIGAGSAGLVTARHLLANGLKCCIFEAAATLGGAWGTGANGSRISIPAEVSTTTTNPMWNGLQTNLSKHTCQFSDFPWPETTPTFPSKDDMDWYLQAYAEEFLLDNGETTTLEDGIRNDGSMCSFLYDCKVTKISPIIANNNDNSNNNLSILLGENGYKVEWTDSVDETQHSKEFGGVVLATGFFSKPKYPSGLIPELEQRWKKQSGSQIFPMEILHSMEYSSHEKFAPAETAQPKKIVVAGSSHSALEIAVDLTKSAEHPVTVVMPTIPWVVPRYVPSNNKDSSSFLPIDLALYQRTHDYGMSKQETTMMTSESCRKKNEYLRALLGPKQDKILPVPLSSFDLPPMVAISDLFLDLVVDGRIRVLQGRLEGLTKDGTGLRISSRDNKNKEEIISDVTSLICCTGYSPNMESCFGSDKENNVDLAHEKNNGLPLNSILETIQYDSKDAFIL